MLNRWTIALFLLIASTAVRADDATDVAALSDHLDHAIIAGDGAAAAPLYCEDFLLTTGGGSFKRKADMLRDIGIESLRFEVNVTQDVQVRVHGDTAVLTGELHQKGRFGEQTFENRFRVTDTWVRGGEQGWCLLAGHASLIAP